MSFKMRDFRDLLGFIGCIDHTMNQGGLAVKWSLRLWEKQFHSTPITESSPPPYSSIIQNVDSKMEPATHGLKVVTSCPYPRLVNFHSTSFFFFALFIYIADWWNHVTSTSVDKYRNKTTLTIPVVITIHRWQSAIDVFHICTCIGQLRHPYFDTTPMLLRTERQELVVLLRR